MKYRGFEITAEVRTYQNWSVDESGNLSQFQYDYEGAFDHNDISYNVANEYGTHLGNFDTFEEAKEAIDKHAKEVTNIPF